MTARIGKHPTNRVRWLPDQRLSGRRSFELTPQESREIPDRLPQVVAVRMDEVTGGPHLNWFVRKRCIPKTSDPLGARISGFLERMRICGS